MPIARPAIALLCGLFALAGFAQSVPTAINYQGRLTDNTPAQVPVTAIVPMKFAIYDALTGGNQKWLEPNPVFPACTGQTAINVAVNQGIFSVALGGYCFPLPAQAFTGTDSNRYLEITVNPGQPNQEILAPRQRITTAGYAHLAENANSAAYASSASSVPWFGITGMPAGFADGTDDGIASLATGNGLSGGPITTNGTINLNLNAAGGMSKTLGAGSNELGIAPGGVVPAHLSAAGSTSGQALVSTGAAVAWGAPSCPPRKYYLTPGTLNGSQALTACAAGYHMASLGEIIHESTLLYDTALGLTTLDAGSGPPSDFSGFTGGWVRTGFSASYTANSAGYSNCAIWTSAVNTSYGTWAVMGAWGSPSENSAPWSISASTCNTLLHVWCMQN